MIGILSCEHRVEFKPSSNTTGSIRCPRCLEEKKLTDIVTQEWQARCTRCSFGKWCASSRDTAERAAKRHWGVTSHRCDVKFSENPAAIRWHDFYKDNHLI